MTKKLLLLITVLFIIPFAYADDWPICIDKIDPEAPGGLSITGNVDLSWDAAIDEPECSGIDHYKVYRDDVVTYTTSSTSFSENPLSDGTYTYRITAVDKGGNEGPGIVGSITIDTGENCGNGEIDTGEDCDGSNLNSKTCSSFGYDKGTLSCTSSCNFDTSACANNIGGSRGSSSSNYRPIKINETNTSTSSSTDCTPDWSCSDWGDCKEGFKERICTDSNNCETDEGKPAEKEECTIFKDDQTDNDYLQSFLEDNNTESESINQTSENSGLAGITGAFIGSDGTFNIIPLLVIFGILGVILLAYFGWGHYKKK